MRDFLEFRLAMEPIASYQAARRASSAAKQDILAPYRDLLAVNEDLKKGSDRQLAIETDIGFYTAIFLASGNHVARYLGTLLTHMMRWQVEETTDRPDEFARGLHLHRDIAEAIAAGDAQSAFNSSYELVRMPYDTYMQRLSGRSEYVPITLP